MGMCGGGGNPGAAARAQEDARQLRISQGMESINNTFQPFNNEFYQKRADDYTAYAMPQLYDQLRQTQRQQYFGLAGRGLQNSSAMQTNLSRLRKETDLQKQGIVDTGISQAQDLRKQIEGQRSNVVAQLNASADPTASAQQALQTAGAYNVPSAFAPIGNLFNNFANLYAVQQMSNAYNGNNYRPSYGMNSPLGNRAATVSRR